MSVAVSENEVEEFPSTSSTPISSPVSLSILLSDLLTNLQNERARLSHVIETFPSENKTVNFPSSLPSTGGRPSFNIKKAQIEQLRDTGMNWRSI